MSIDAQSGNEHLPLSHRLSHRAINVVRGFILCLALVPVACVDRPIIQIERPNIPHRVELEEIPILRVGCYLDIVDKCYFAIEEGGDQAEIRGRISSLDWIKNPDHIPFVLEWTKIRIFQNGQWIDDIPLEQDGTFKTDLVKGAYEMFAQVQAPPNVEIIQQDPIEEGVLSPVYPFYVVEESELPRG